MIAEQKTPELAQQDLLPPVANVGNNTLSLLVQQNSLLLSQLSMLHSQLNSHLELPLKAALERKRLKVMSACPAIGKDLLVQFKTGSEYTTTDTNVVKNAIKPLLDANMFAYQCTPLSHTVTPQQNGSHLYRVALRFTVTDCETGYCETIPGEWYGIWIGSLDKGYASAITNGTGKFLISYFNIACFDRPEEIAADATGNQVVIRERKKTGAATQPAGHGQPTKQELDYGKCKAIFSAIKTSDEVKKKYEGMVKDKDCVYDKGAMKRAFIERFYQIEDLDLSDENQHRFITENWKGTLYEPSGNKNEYRIYVFDAEIGIRTPETVENLKKLAQFKTVK